MIAARTQQSLPSGGYDTACPPRRACVAGAARRRGQACLSKRNDTIACGGPLPTPALRASVDNARRFSVIVDD
jgi:hypothetical protein